MSQKLEIFTQYINFHTCNVCESVKHTRRLRVAMIQIVSIVFSIVTLLPMVMQGEGRFLLLKVQGPEKGGMKFPPTSRSSDDTGSY